MADEERFTSRVKFFDPVNGYGFIDDPGHLGEDVFVHAEEIREAGLAILRTDQQITFEITDYGKGPAACNIEAGNCHACHGTGFAFVR